MLMKEVARVGKLCVTLRSKFCKFLSAYYCTFLTVKFLQFLLELLGLHSILETSTLQEEEN
jgi:hypothetical protein